jgi:hypothetical protein
VRKYTGLAEHAGLGFDAAHAPTDHSDAVDHRGMRIGADQGVGIEDTVLLVHAACEVFEIDLMHDADAGRNHLEGIERLHAPLHELIAFLVALELELHVQIEHILVAIVVDLHRVIDHQIDRDQRLDHLWIAAHAAGHTAHRSEID